MKVTLNLDDRKVRRALKKLVANTDASALKPVVDAAAQPILSEAKARCPVLTGALRSSIELKVTSGKHSAKARVVTRKFYASFLELGSNQLMQS